MNDYEVRRAEQIKRNQALLKDLNIEHAAKRTCDRDEDGKATKRQKTSRPPAPAPTRSSARIKASDVKPEYNEDKIAGPPLRSRTSRQRPARPPPAGTSEAQAQRLANINYDSSPDPLEGKGTSRFGDLEELQASWTSWMSSAPEPTRDTITREFDFADHPDFRPNLSPAEMLQQGAFGGSYFRPYRSKTLSLRVQDDWHELPSSWLEGLDVDKFVCSSAYDPEVNKYGVACGQSIEEWEAAGWIDHRYDVRGWFQWYCRFFQGRRCPDDERQISRWKKCVGETGRWRRILLKRYVAMGIRSVTDEGDEEGEEEAREVSPAVHQTCHHWAYEIRQEALDRWWTEGR